MIYQIDEYLEMSFNNVRDIKMIGINANGLNMLSYWTSNKKYLFIAMVKWVLYQSSYEA